MGKVGFFGQHFKLSHMIAPLAQFTSTHMGQMGGGGGGFWAYVFICTIFNASFFFHGAT